jgi:hypothetical protein
MTKRKNESQIEMEVALFRSKLKDELDQGLKPILKPNCHLRDGKIFMMCVVCKEEKERTTEFFYPNHGGKKFKTCRSGKEALHNSQSCPCILCATNRPIEFHKTEDGFVYNLIRTYKNDGLTMKWFYKTLKQQQYVGPISGKKLQLVQTKLNSAGIHAYDNYTDHTEANCFLEVQNINVSQHEAIPCLFCAWKELYSCLIDQHVFPEKQNNSQHLEFVRSQYFVKPKDIGIIQSNLGHIEYKQQKRNLHFTSILRTAIYGHIRRDIEAKRFELPKNITRLQFIDIVFDNSIKQLEKQLWKCGYTDVNLTIVNLWTRFSFERIDDDLPHFTQTGELTNIVFICRLLNSAKKLSKEVIMDYLLHQNLIDVPDYVRILINTKSSKDWVTPKLWSQREIDLFEFVSSNFTNNTLSCDYCFLKNQIE